MTTADNPPQGAYPQASNYPNPLANNVNMHPIPWKHQSDDATPVPLTVAQNAPVRINGAGGSSFEGA
jgi:hypothetical protein